MYKMNDPFYPSVENSQSRPLPLEIGRADRVLAILVMLR